MVNVSRYIDGFVILVGVGKAAWATLVRILFIISTVTPVENTACEVRLAKALWDVGVAAL